MSDHEHLINPDPLADSAGVPWKGRHFEANSWSGDDGSADPGLIDALDKFQAGQADAENVLEALREARVLVPLLAALGDYEIGAHGHAVDKSAELSIVTVQTPDLQDGLPVFSSVTAMANWNKDARPVPVSAAKAALAAAAENNTRLVLDAGNSTEFVLRRPAIAALAQSVEWVHPVRNEHVSEAFQDAVGNIQEIIGFQLEDGDPKCTLSGAEVLLVLKLIAGLTREQLDAVMQRLAKNLSESHEIAEYVDSLRVKLASA